MSDEQKIIILGASSLARVLKELFEDTPQYEVVGFLINQPPFVRGSELAGKPIFWIDDLDDLIQEHKAICSIYQIRKASFIENVKSRGMAFINFFHPSSYAVKSVVMGEGNIITQGVQISSDTHIGNHTIINRGTLIGHEVIIEDYVSLAPGVNIASGVKIGTGTYVGMGAIIPQNISIGKGCFIGAGSLVTQDVPDGVKVIGMPARIVEREIGDSFL